MSQTARLRPTSQCMLWAPLPSVATEVRLPPSPGACSSGGFLGYGWIEVFVRPAFGWQDMTQPTATLALNNKSTYNYLGQYLSISSDGNPIVSTGFFPVHTSSTPFLFTKPAGGRVNMAPSVTTLLSSNASGAEAVAIGPSNTIAVTNRSDWTVRVYQRIPKASSRSQP